MGRCLYVRPVLTCIPVDDFVTIFSSSPVCGPRLLTPAEVADECRAAEARIASLAEEAQRQRPRWVWWAEDVAPSSNHSGEQEPEFAHAPRRCEPGALQGAAHVMA